MSRVDTPHRKWSVLVVDDDPGIQGLFHTVLERTGFSVDTAPNGRDAFEYLRRGSYAVILLDLMMPDVNGFELLERIERSAPHLLSHVIVMTGASHRSLEQFDPSRLWGLIRKPFDLDEFVTSTVACAQGQPRSAAVA
jgi:CheY-like chemotaxis protein